MTEDFGTDPHKLVRKNDPDTSHEAAAAVNTTKLESAVYDAIEWGGPLGMTSDEVRARFPGLPYSSVTARYRALLDKGLIFDCGMRRPGNSGRSQRVLVATKWRKEAGHA